MGYMYKAEYGKWVEMLASIPKFDVFLSVAIFRDPRDSLIEECNYTHLCADIALGPRHITLA